MIAEPFHVHLFGVHRETACFELRQVEDVTDEPLQPCPLTCDDIEGGCASLGILRDAFPQCVDMTADRGQRRAQLVRDAHEEVALLPLGVRQARGHLPEAVGEVSDLTAAAHVRQVDVVAAPRNLVGRTRERKHGPRDAPRQVPAEQSRDDDSAERRDRQPLQEWDQLVVQLRLRLRDDQVAECGPLLPQLQRTRDGEIGLLCARRRELERDRSAGTPVDCALR